MHRVVQHTVSFSFFLVDDLTIFVHALLLKIQRLLCTDHLNQTHFIHRHTHRRRRELAIKVPRHQCIHQHHHKCILERHLFTDPTSLRLFIRMFHAIFLCVHTISKLYFRQSPNYSPNHTTVGTDDFI